MNELHLFAGSGGGILGGLLLGHRPVCAVEIDAYNQRVLRQRISDGCLPHFPIFGDIREFDGEPWRGVVDILCGGFPCQDISPAGKRAGIGGEKSGLWKEYLRIVREVRPRLVFAENSSQLINNGLGDVLQDLSEAGYDAQWGVFSASFVGAPHGRNRCFLLAYPMQQRSEGDRRSSWIERWKRCVQEVGKDFWKRNGPWAELRETESQLERVLPNGVAYGVDRHYAIGNGQIPCVAALAFKTLSGKESHLTNDALDNPM